MTIQGFLLVGMGAAMGAWLRWWLSLVLNPLFPTIPLGTLASNLIAGLLIGVAVEVVTRVARLQPEVGWLVITGFLGGLSTFSTFSAEIVTLIMRKQLWWSVAAVSAHLFGSVLLTIAGILIVRAVFSTEPL
jgi:fluoride exporter